jgi:hypothetical protein
VAQRTSVGTQYYLDELRRREDARRTRTMVWLTAVITVLTLANTVAVIVALAAD